MSLRTDLPVAISYSGGCSSAWLVLAMWKGLFPVPNKIAVMWAPMPEHWWTFAEVEWMRVLCASLGIAFYECAAATRLDDDLMAIREGGVTRVDQPPLWIAKGGGRGKAVHRCTKHYKVAPMRRSTSAWVRSLGMSKKVVKWIGFAADEAHRAIKTVGKQKVQWELLDFPAIRLGISRAQMRQQYEDWTGRPAPKFSMCVFCPFKSPRRWHETTGDDLDLAVRVDEAIRDLDCIGLTEGPAYLTDRLIPVADLVRNGDPQPTLPGLESYCDGGACFL